MQETRTCTEEDKDSGYLVRDGFLSKLDCSQGDDADHCCVEAREESIYLAGEGLADAGDANGNPYMPKAPGRLMCISRFSGTEVEWFSPPNKQCYDGRKEAKMNQIQALVHLRTSSS
jgi:hypothetical protein